VIRRAIASCFAESEGTPEVHGKMDLSKHMRFQSVRLVGAVGIETTAAWHFNDLRSRARYEKEGLGSPWNPYRRLNAAFFPMMLRTTLRFASRTAFGIACV